MALKDSDMVFAHEIKDALNALLQAQCGETEYYGNEVHSAVSMLQDILEIDETER